MLSEILNRCGSDKATYHSYGALYDEWFAPYRESATAVLEVGIYGGASVRAWHEFFVKAHIVGVDLYLMPDTKLPPNRFTYVQADSKKPDILHWHIDDLRYEVTASYDIVIDDGCHERMAQVATFAVLWPHVKRGGLYVIEDIQRAKDGIEIANTFGGEFIDRRVVLGREDDMLVLFRK